jgi:hypothetical protein
MCSEMIDGMYGKMSFENFCIFCLCVYTSNDLLGTPPNEKKSDFYFFVGNLLMGNANFFEIYNYYKVYIQQDKVW